MKDKRRCLMYEVCFKCGDLNKINGKKDMKNNIYRDIKHLVRDFRSKKNIESSQQSKKEGTSSSSEEE